MASSIGSYSFVRMSPQPLTAAQRVQAESRAGVAGVGLWLLGAAGQEYTVETVAIYSTFANAVTGANNYRTLIGAAAQAIVYGGQSCGNVVVLGVEARAERIVKGFSSGGTALAIVTANWRLIAV